jgi:virginiamycin B lyase
MAKTHRLGLAALAALVLGHAEAATLTGKIATSSGEPVAGAMVTLWNAAHDRKETVYSDAEGRYRLTTAFTGKVMLRGRAASFSDVTFEFALGDAAQSHDFALQKMTDPQEISDSLTASAHAATLQFPDGKTKRAFISQCSYCHQQGNALTRRPRDRAEWDETAWRMEGYGAFITYGEHRRIVDTQFKTFNQSHVVTAVQLPTFSPEQAHAKVEEWFVGDGLSFLHDTMVGQDDKLYGIDEGKDIIYRLDRKTSQIEALEIPVTPDMPVGGRMAAARLPIGIFTGKQGPHSGAQISDGRIFFTAALSGRLLELNPTTLEWKQHVIPAGFLWRKGIYPHTIRADKDDNLWFTVTLSNRLMKYDPKTGEFTDYGLPSHGVLRWMTDMFLGTVMKIGSFFPGQNLQLALSHHKWLNGGADAFNWPYGIDIDPQDNSVWYAKLLSDRIGTIDRATGKIEEIETPFKGPRRMRFDRDGILWIPSFDDGKLLRFDPKTRVFESIDLPTLGKGEWEMPYALNVHPKTGDVWIAANNTDRILRYIPAEKRFIAYPMPNRVIWFRDLEFTQDGKVCSSNSNLPAYGHEDGVAAFVCLEPEENGQYGK